MVIFTWYRISLLNVTYFWAEWMERLGVIFTYTIRSNYLYSSLAIKSRSICKYVVLLCSRICIRGVVNWSLFIFNSLIISKISYDILLIFYTKCSTDRKM